MTLLGRASEHYQSQYIDKTTEVKQPGQEITQSYTAYQSMTLLRRASEHYQSQYIDKTTEVKQPGQENHNHTLHTNPWHC